MGTGAMADGRVEEPRPARRLAVLRHGVDILQGPESKSRNLPGVHTVFLHPDRTTAYPKVTKPAPTVAD